MRRTQGSLISIDQNYRSALSLCLSLSLDLAIASQELERLLFERLNGAKELMCEVVFDIKKLLAIECSLDQLISANTSKK
jgi:hypothetical protein